MLFCPVVHNLADAPLLVKYSVYDMTAEDPKMLRSLIQRVLDEAPFSMRQLADEAGISYDAIRSWATERRTPRPENLEALAAAIERRGERLHEIAHDVQRAITGSSHS